jgi:hypothetical protein
MELRKRVKRLRLTMKDFGKLVNVPSVDNWRTLGVPNHIVTYFEVFDLLTNDQKEEFISRKLGIE